MPLAKLLNSGLLLPDTTMHIRLYLHGKTKSRELSILLEEYRRRASFYSRLEIEVIPELKNARGKDQVGLSRQEDLRLLKAINPSDTLILLDEKGDSPNSREFAALLENYALHARGPLCFAIGGPYGFGELARERSDRLLSLSPMTFPHDLVRLIFLEQLYRAFTILRNEPYHHD